MEEKIQRQTGRTTRMLREAVALAQAGRAVYVLAATVAQARAMKLQVGCGVAERLGIKFGTPKSIDLNWERMYLPGAHPNCVLLADHYAIELHLEKALAMLHRYDLPAFHATHATTRPNWYDRFSDRKFLGANCNPTTLDGLCRSEPGWAANRIRVLECAVAELLELADRHRVVLPRNYQSKEE